MSQKVENIWITLFYKTLFFLRSLISSVQGLLGAKKNEDTEYDTLDYIIRKAPEEWGQKPSGIRLGRMLAQEILYFFQKNAYFSKK